MSTCRNSLKPFGFVLCSLCICLLTTTTLAHFIQIEHGDFHTNGYPRGHLPPPPPPPPLPPLENLPQHLIAKELTPLELMVDLSNDLTNRILHFHSILNRNNFAFSPTALMSVLIALYEGSAGRSANELRSVLQLPSNRDVIRIGYRDVHRRLRTYFFGSDNPLNGLSLNKDNVTITANYETILMFYGYDLGIDMVSSTVSPATTTDATTSDMNNTTTSAANATALEPPTESATTTADSTTETAATTTATTEATTTEETASTTTTEATTTTEEAATTEAAAETPAESTEAAEAEETEATTEAEGNEAAELVSAFVAEVDAEPLLRIQKARVSRLPTSKLQAPLKQSYPITPKPNYLPSARSMVAPSMQFGMSARNVPPGGTNARSTQGGGGGGGMTARSTQGGSMISAAGAQLGGMPAKSVQGSMSARSAAAQGSTTTTGVHGGTKSRNQNQAGMSAQIKRDDKSTNTATRKASSRYKRHILSSYKDLDAKLFVSLFNPHAHNHGPPLFPLPAPQPTAGAAFAHLINDFELNVAPPHFIADNGDAKQNFNADVISHVFYLGSQQIVHTTFKVYNAVLYFKYFEHLKMSVLELELDTPEYNLMILLPDYHMDIVAAAASLKLGPTLRLMRKQLKPRWVQAIIPDFRLQGTMFLTNDLQNMGVCDVFEPNRADFRPMTDEKGIYVRHIEQSINVNIRTHPINQLKRNYGAQAKPIQISVNHPFLFFIIDRDLDVAVMAGRILNPLNVRIQ